MYLDVSLGQLGWLRPTRNAVITGAGTAPVGAIGGAPGRAAAQAVLACHPRPLPPPPPFPRHGDISGSLRPAYADMSPCRDRGVHTRWRDGC